MSDFSTTYLPPPPVVNNFSSEPSVQDDLHQNPPSYGSLNPSVFRNTYNVNAKPTQRQPQPQWGVQGNTGNTHNIHSAPTVYACEINHVENYMVWSVLNIIFCCLCLGCVACYYSSETNNFKLRGDIQGALNASRNARKMNIVATLLGIVVIILNVLVIMHNTS